MRLELRPLLTLGVTHGYYGGTCREVAFPLPAETERLLRGARLLARTRGGRLHVLFERGEDGKPLVDCAGRTLRIGVELLDPAAPVFTTPPVDPRQGLAVYANSSDRQRLGQPAAVARDALAPELRRAGLVALVEVTVEDAFFTSPPAFEIALAARSEPLSYYVVAGNHAPAEVAALSVSDAGAAGEGDLQLEFARVPLDDLGPADIDPALLGHPDTPVVVFRSATPLARRQRPGRRVLLHRNGEALALPLPGGSAPNGSLVVHVSKPKP